MKRIAMKRNYTMKRMGRSGFTLVELLVVIAIMGTLMSLLLPAVQAVREAARKTTCKANLVQTVHAMQLYHDAHQHYPPGLDADPKAEPAIPAWFGHTAWIHLLNYLEAGNIYKQYNFQLISTDIRNELARGQNVPVFQCPTDETSERTVEIKGDAGEFSRSNYAVCFGSETMGGRKLSDKKTDGAFRVGKSRRERDFYNGKTHTVMVAELITGTRDKYASNAYDVRGVWAYHEMGAFAYTHFQLPNSKEPDLMRFGSGQKDCVDLPEMPCADEGQGKKWNKYRVAARSRHAGGVFIAYADERVEWVGDDIELDVWRRMGSTAKDRRTSKDDDEEFRVLSSDRF